MKKETEEKVNLFLIVLILNIIWQSFAFATKDIDDILMRRAIPIHSLNEVKSNSSFFSKIENWLIEGIMFKPYRFSSFDDQSASIKNTIIEGSSVHDNFFSGECLIGYDFKR